MKIKHITFIYFLIFDLFFLFPCYLMAHEGHDHAPGEDENIISTGPITITPQAKNNLKLETFETQVGKINKITTVLGSVDTIPNQTYVITSRISGKITEVFVVDGQNVKKGAPLIEIESRQVGDPPPRVTYRSPFDGVVIDHHIMPGSSVEPDRHLMKIADLSEIYIVGSIFESDIAGIKKGQAARVKIESYPSETFESSVELIGGALDPISKTMRVWLRLKNPDLKLRPNMNATTHIISEEALTAIIVPRISVIGDSADKFVFIQSEEDEYTFERRRIVTGIHDDKHTEIIEGIFPGERVVTEGAYQLQYVTPLAKEEE